MMNELLLICGSVSRSDDVITLDVTWEDIL